MKPFFIHDDNVIKEEGLSVLKDYLIPNYSIDQKSRLFLSYLLSHSLKIKHTLSMYTLDIETIIPRIQVVGVHSDLVNLLS